MTTIDPDKYVVFHRDTFHGIIQQACSKLNSLQLAMDLTDVQLDDAVVIRKRDVFAAPALYAYAATIQSVIEVQEASQKVDTDHLRELVDFFAGEADQARRIQGKVPD